VIRLVKAKKPAILVDHDAEWTKVVVDKAAAGQKPTQVEATRYRHPGIKDALVAETSNKCAYCESKLQHIHHGDVEHIMPKSLEPSRIFEWENLTLACEVCNQNKSNLDPNANKLIDPYQTNPRDHLVFAGPFIFATGSAPGIATRTILDLDRGELIESRLNRLKAVMGIYSEILRPDIPLHARRIIYRNLLETEAAPNTAHSGMILDLIETMKTRVPNELST
jgi:5-methylcytosine-specific restriction endonuclease McrA